MAWSGLWNNEYGENYSVLINTKPTLARISNLIRRRGKANRVINELFDTVLGAAAGGTAAATYPRVQHPTDEEFGGARTVETVTAINRASTAADITALKLIFSDKSKPATYPADLSGNGGGGKLNRF